MFSTPRGTSRAAWPEMTERPTFRPAFGRPGAFTPAFGDKVLARRSQLSSPTERSTRSSRWRYRSPLVSQANPIDSFDPAFGDNARGDSCDDDSTEVDEPARGWYWQPRAWTPRLTEADKAVDSDSDPAVGAREEEATQTRELELIVLLEEELQQTKERLERAERERDEAREEARRLREANAQARAQRQAAAAAELAAVTDAANDIRELTRRHEAELAAALQDLLIQIAAGGAYQDR